MSSPEGNQKLDNSKSSSVYALTREKSYQFQSLIGLGVFFKPYKWGILVATIVLIVTAMLSLILPLAVRRVVDGFFEQSETQIDQYFFVAIFIAGLLALGTASRFYLVTRLGERIVADIRIAVFNRVIGMSPQFFEKILTGEVLSRLTTDTTLLLSVVSSSVSLSLRNALIFIGSLLLMFATSLELASYTLLIVPVVLIPVLFLGKKLRNLSNFSQEKIAESSGIASEMLLSYQTIQANTQENFSKMRYKAIAEKAFNIAKQRILIRSILTAVLIFFVFTGIVAVLWVGALNVRQGSMSQGQLVQFLIYAVLVAGSIAQLTDVYGELQRAAGASERLIELLNLDDKIYESEEPKIFDPRKRKIQLKFDNVSFNYPTRKESFALENFSLTVSAGEKIAIVGPSGSGKTTIFQLLLRFYDVTSGAIYIDGINIQDLTLKDLRNCFALVPQESTIFAMSARENIKFSRPDAVDQEVYNAAAAADAEKFILDLQKGYDTYLGEKGVRLSGGQKQRVAIARAILRDSSILLFDEATASLDSVSETAVQRAVDDLSKTRTTIVIAHRLSTVKKADRIIVLESGKIVADGRHDELVQKDGIYAKLAKLQFANS